MNIPERSKDFEMMNKRWTCCCSNIHERRDAHHNRSGHYKMKPKLTTARIWIKMWKNTLQSVWFAEQKRELILRLCVFFLVLEKVFLINFQSYLWEILVLLLQHQLNLDYFLVLVTEIQFSNLRVLICSCCRSKLSSKNFKVSSSLFLEHVSWKSWQIKNNSSFLVDKISNLLILSTCMPAMSSEHH